VNVSAWLNGARWALAGVFLVAALSKALASRGARRQQSLLVDLGVAPRLDRIVSWLLPIVEAVIAVACVVTSGPWAPLSAAMLLIVFTLVLVRALRRGTTTPCNCFGMLQTRALSWKAVLRNVVLLALAVLAIGGNTTGSPTLAAFALFAGATICIVTLQ
jgi:hypothetical protein